MSIKVLFLSSRPFGQYGTPGIYRFVEEINRYCSVRVIAPPPSSASVSFKKNTPLIPISGRSSKRNIARLAAPMRQFSPDVIYIFQNPRASEAIELLKEILPDTPIVLDIKSPLLERFDQHGNDIIFSSSNRAKYIDRILTLARSSAASWFNDLPIEPTIYPLAIDASCFQGNIKTSAKNDVRSLAFVSSLHPKRKVGMLIEGFSHYLRAHDKKMVLHIYGDGDDRKHLESKVLQLGLKDYVVFHGLVSQELLWKELSKCDAGIAWVPRELYDDSSSLKLLEYMAAGIPVLATATSAHLALKAERFSINYCEDTPEGVAGGLERLAYNCTDIVKIRDNQEKVKKHDYSEVVSKYIFPIIQELSRSPKIVEPPEQKKIMHRQHENNSSTMRILIICNSLAGGKGGAEKVATDLAASMSARGHLCYLGYENRGEPAYKVDDSVVLLPFDKPGELRSFILEAELDCVVVFYFNKRNLSRFVAQIEGTDVPLVVQECTNPDRLRFRNWGLGRLSRARASWERGVVTSAAARLRLVMPNYCFSFPDYQRGQVRAFPNSAKPTTIRSNPGNNQDGEKLTILVVNGFKPNKNLQDLLKAFGFIANKYPNWLIRVIGKEPNWQSPHACEIKGIIDACGINEQVEILGPTDNILYEMGKSQIHVIPSLAEGCPTVVLEAMAVGLPSVGFADCPGTNELIQHEVNGLLVASDDRVHQLSESLSYLMSNPEERKRLGEQALADSSNFSPDKTYDQWESLLQEASEYKGNPLRLLKEQQKVDKERILHARRMRRKILEEL